MMTALVLQLVQSTVHAPTVSSLLAAGKVDDVREHLIQAQQEGEQVATTLVETLVGKCGKPQDEGGFKAILTGLTEDCLVVLNFPEWPAAEIVLRKLAKKLLPLTLPKSDASEGKSKDAPSSKMRGLALDLLGMIAATVRVEMNELDRLIEEFSVEVSAAAVDADAVAASGSGRGGKRRRSGGGAADGDGCSAAGGANGEAVPIGWREDEATERKDAAVKRAAVDLCYELRMGQALPQKRVQRATDVLQDALLEYCNAHAAAEPTLRLARDHDAAVFVASDLKAHMSSAGGGAGEGGASVTDRAIVEADRAPRCAAIAARLEPVTSSGAAVAISHDVAHVVRRVLALSLPLMKGFPPMLQHILAALKYTENQLRIRALKSLGKVIEVDWTVLTLKNVKKDVERMCTDRQISVRAEVVDLFGRFVLQQPDLTDQYVDTVTYAPFCIRLLC